MEGDLKMLSVIEVQKELMKSKVIAKLSHYTSGSLYYTVELESGIHQFPIGTVETGTLAEIIGPCETNDLENEGFIDVGKLYTLEEVKRFQERRKLSDERDGILVEDNPIEVKVSKLSTDLGTTTFYGEMRGSELFRWIKKAIEKEEFIKVG